MRVQNRNPISTPAGDVVDKRSHAGMICGVVIVSMLAVISIALVSRSSAAFTASTDTDGSSFSSGSVDLVDDDVVGNALINVADLKPGQSVTDCIVVTYQGSIPDPAGVKLYSGGYTDTGTFGDHLDITVEEGTGGTFHDCTGFGTENTIVAGQALSAFDAARTDYATGVGVWDPSGTPQAKTYRVTAQLDPATPTGQQNQGVTDVTFTWEVQT